MWRRAFRTADRMCGQRKSVRVIDGEHVGSDTSDEHRLAGLLVRLGYTVQMNGSQAGVRDRHVSMFLTGAQFLLVDYI